MGLFSRTKPKIKVESKKSDNFSGWVKCSGCGEMIHAHELVNHLNCCPKCGYHYRLTADQRIALVADENSFQEMFSYLKPVDPLNFEDSKKYTKRLQEAALKSKHDEAVIVGHCAIKKTKVALAVLDFSFMGGSMGSVVGERISLLIEYATENDLPLVIVSASGGARMQESILSLMQMAKTSAALTKLHQKRLPYISVLTNPTTGGVTASFASLGDIIVAEPDALIAFAGPRVVEQTIRQKLPPKAQKSEFLLDKGMIDCIIQRKDLKDKLFFFINFLMNNKREIGKERMPEKLKDLLKLAEEQTAQDIL